jgi:hypothetical protein
LKTKVHLKKVHQKKEGVEVVGKYREKFCAQVYRKKTRPRTPLTTEPPFK